MSRVLKDAKNQITCGYSSNHQAVDLVKYKDKTCYVIAHSKGVVVWIQKNQKHNPGSSGNASYGNCVKLKHEDGYYTLYAHLENVKVKLNESVKEGQILGYMGDTGNAYGKHLHFEIRNEKDERINPTDYLNKNLPKRRVEYQVYDNKKNKWLPKVFSNTKEYAGNIGNPISGLKVSNLTYRVHDKIKKTWLPYVTGDKSYAGNIPNDIDGIQIKNCKYRVHLVNGKWLSWVNKVDNTKDGYAGIIGKSIDCVQIA